MFKPTNLDGFDDNLGVERYQCVRYFDQGDAVRVLEGKYKGESGIITTVNETKVHMPKVKLDTLGLEISINTLNLRMKDLREQEPKPSLIQSMNPGNNKLQKQPSVDLVFKVGDIVLYDGNKMHGYVIKVENDLLQVVNENCQMAYLRYKQIDKKIPMNKTRVLRDSKGFVIQIDDPVKVVSKHSPFYEQVGIIKNMVKNQLFLWSTKFMGQSNGIFVENCNKVRIQGHDIIEKEQARPEYVGARQPVNQNRIQRDKLLNKKVIIQRGQFKGHIGRCTHVNGDQASIELSIRAKKVNLPVKDLVEADSEEGMMFKSGAQNPKQGGQDPDDRRGPHDAGAGQDDGFAPGDFGQTEYRGGNTQYGGGMTAYEGRTPSYFPQTQQQWGDQDN